MKIAEYNALSMKGNKYKAQKTLFCNEVYDSKKEAEYAQKLDTLTHAKNKNDRVVKIERQLRFPLEVNNIKIATYVLDFKVTYGDKHVEYVDVKGYKKGIAYRMFTLKKSLVKAIYDIDILEI